MTDNSIGSSGYTTTGDCIFIIEKLIARGFIKERMENGKLVYDVTNLAKECFYQCSNCGKYFSALKDIDRHQEFKHSSCYHKDTHFYSKNQLTQKQIDFITKEMQP